MISYVGDDCESPILIPEGSPAKESKETDERQKINAINKESPILVFLFWFSPIRFHSESIFKR
jgi:hypothetical protein